MTYIVKMYDLQDFMFAHKWFKTEAKAKEYASGFKRNKAVVEKVL